MTKNERRLIRVAKEVFKKYRFTFIYTEAKDKEEIEKLENKCKDTSKYYHDGYLKVYFVDPEEEDRITKVNKKGYYLNIYIDDIFITMCNEHEDVFIPKDAFRLPDPELKDYIHSKVDECCQVYFDCNCCE